MNCDAQKQPHNDQTVSLIQLCPAAPALGHVGDRATCAQRSRPDKQARLIYYVLPSTSSRWFSFKGHLESALI